MSAFIPQITRFGLFEVDLRSGELHKQGLKIRLQEQPFQVLAMLLERPGELVTRDEIRRKLWLEDTFVDFDHGLNSAINKIREALGDSADNPRFIQTLARRGYRFIAPISTEQSDGTTTVAVARLQAPAEIARAPLAKTISGAADLAIRGAQPEMALGLPAASGRDIPRQALESAIDGVIEAHASSVRWQRWVAGLAAAFLALGIVVALYVLRRPPPAPEVMGFDRVTNDGRQKLVSVELGSPILTDGLRLYFMEWMEGHAVPVQVSVKGGDVAPINVPSPLAKLADIAPDQSGLLVAGFTATEPDAPLWIIPVPGGTPRRLGDLIGHDGTWSPDGRRLLYAKGYGLYIAKPNGSDSHRLVKLSGMAYWPRWSPDGRVVRFTVNDPTTDSDTLWEVAADGSGLHPLFPAAKRPPNACCGNWTPDGTYFIFESSDSGKTNIWTVREKQGLFHTGRREPAALTAGPMNFAGPVSSLDGKQLFAVGAQRRGELVRYDPKVRDFSAYLAGISVEGAYFSRDNAWAAYTAYPEGTLWRSRVDGSERLQLTFPPMKAELPRWSPDGQRITFMGQLPGRPWRIYLISADGGTPEQLLPGEPDEADPNWSPDGKSLVFGGAPWASGGASGATEIEIVELKSREISIVPGSQGLYSPRWSPTGCCLVALPADSQKLVLYDFSTGKWEDLANAPADYPAWSRDGRYVYFGNPGISPSILRVGVRERKIERMADLTQIRRAFGYFGPWFGLGPEDSLLLVRDTGSEEIYALDARLP